MRASFIWLVIACLVSSLACNQKQNPQDLKEKTAKATAEMKRDAKAVAEGIREGWSRDRPLNINTATKDQLMSLPGITSSRAEAIIAARPYDDPSDLVKRKILSKDEYDKIADRLIAK
jgi:DNA uptake protein ComE-like DNA-binding protein